MADKTTFTAKQIGVMEILRASGEAMFAFQIAAEGGELFEKGAKSVSPLMNGLVARNLVTKTKAECVRPDKDGNDVTKSLTLYQLTDAGKEIELIAKVA